MLISHSEEIEQQHLLTKLENIDHIKEHLESLDFKLENEDLDLLNNFKIPNYKQPLIDCNNLSLRVTIDQVSNVFENKYLKQNSN